MHKPEQQTDGDEDDAAPRDTDQTETGVVLQALTETMEHPEFTAEQLPELWHQTVGQHDTEPGETPLDRLRRDRWKQGIDAMYRRCATYPQYAQLAVILSAMPNSAWRDTGRIIHQSDELLEQATPTQLRQALIYEQQHPEGWWRASDHILASATVEQITGPVVEQLTWHDWFRIYATTPGIRDIDPAFEDSKWRRVRHIVTHIQQQLCGGNDNTWAVFLGIVDRGTVIGETAELANTVEQQTAAAPARDKNGTTTAA